MALMKIKINRYFPIIDKNKTRTLSYNELISLPIDTFVVINNDLYLYKGQSTESRYIELYSTNDTNLSPYSYYFKHNAYVHFPLPSDTTYIKAYKGSKFLQITCYNQYTSNPYEYTYLWSSLFKRIYLVNDSVLDNFIMPFTPSLDCLSSALKQNIDLGVTI